MEKAGKGVQRILVLGASVVRQAWIDIALLLLAGVLIGSGVYLGSGPEWTVRAAIQAYNRGVSAYLAPPGLLPSSEDRPAEYPIERAAAYFKKAGSESTDERLKSLAFYNLGTLIGREAYAFSIVSTPPRVEMAEAILWLKQGVRNDPDNEDAKFNLELLERVQVKEGEKEGGPGPGYSPGAVEKGY